LKLTFGVEHFVFEGIILDCVCFYCYDWFWLFLYCNGIFGYEFIEFCVALWVNVIFW